MAVSPHQLPAIRHRIRRQKMRPLRPKTRTRGQKHEAGLAETGNRRLGRRRPLRGEKNELRLFIDSNGAVARLIMNIEESSNVPPPAKNGAEQTSRIEWRGLADGDLTRRLSSALKRPD
jgi:hypothetical protein